MWNSTIDNFLKINSQKILNDGPLWAQFILLQAEDQNYRQVKKHLVSHPNMLHVINKLTDEKLGISSFQHKPASFRNYNSYFWTLRFLADLGLTAADLNIEALIYRLHLQQSEDGQFILDYNQKKQQAIELICMTAHLTDCLIGLGYQNSKTVQAALKFMLTTQRHDSGWHCERVKQNGEQNESDMSCLSASLFCLRVLGRFVKKFDFQAEPAIKFCINQLENSAMNECTFNAAGDINFGKLRYPPHSSGLDVLNVFDTLTLFPDLISKSVFEKFADRVLANWDGKNYLKNQKRIPGWSMFNFGHNNQYSAWITAIFIRALKRIYF